MRIHLPLSRVVLEFKRDYLVPRPWGQGRGESISWSLSHSWNVPHSICSSVTCARPETPIHVSPLGPYFSVLLNNTLWRFWARMGQKILSQAPYGSSRTMAEEECGRTLCSPATQNSLQPMDSQTLPLKLGAQQPSQVCWLFFSHWPLSTSLLFL